MLNAISTAAVARFFTQESQVSLESRTLVSFFAKPSNYLIWMVWSGVHKRVIAKVKTSALVWISL